jgi:hypothetical protein
MACSSIDYLELTSENLENNIANITLYKYEVDINAKTNLESVGEYSTPSYNVLGGVPYPCWKTCRGEHRVFRHDYYYGYPCLQICHTTGYTVPRMKIFNGFNTNFDLKYKMTFHTPKLSLIETFGPTGASIKMSEMVSVSLSNFDLKITTGGLDFHIPIEDTIIFSIRTAQTLSTGAIAIPRFSVIQPLFSKNIPNTTATKEIPDIGRVTVGITHVSANLRFCLNPDEDNGGRFCSINLTVKFSFQFLNYNFVVSESQNIPITPKSDDSPSDIIDILKSAVGEAIP